MSDGWDDDELDRSYGTGAAALASDLLAYAGGPARVPTGLASVDEVLGGGLGSSEVCVVVGRSGSGKSLVGQNFVEANLDRPSIFLSLEMAPAMTAQRSLSIWKDIASSTVRDQVRSNQLDVDLLLEWRKEHSRVWWFTEGWVDLDRMGDVMWEATSQLGERPHLVVIDYLELVGAGAGGEAAIEAVVAVARGLKEWAKKERTAVVVLHQTNSSVRRGEAIRPHNVRYGGFTEADVVLGVWRPHEWEPRHGSSDPPLSMYELQELEQCIALNVIKNRPAVVLDEQGWLFGIRPSGRIERYSHRSAPRR